jgi:hypothetical protein
MVTIAYLFYLWKTGNADNGELMPVLMADILVSLSFFFSILVIAAMFG